MSGEGEVSQYGGENGDLYIVINVKNHVFLEREGNHLYCEVPIRIDQDIFGDEIEMFLGWFGDAWGMFLGWFGDVFGMIWGWFGDDF